MAVHNSIDQPQNIVIRACTMRLETDEVNAFVESTQSLDDQTRSARRQQGNESRIVANTTATTAKSILKLQLSSWGIADSYRSADALIALKLIQQFLRAPRSSSGVVFVYSNGVIAATFAGEVIGRHSAIVDAIDKLTARIKNDGLAMTTVLQSCDYGRGSDEVFGTGVGMRENFHSMQRMLRSWTLAECVEPSDDPIDFGTVVSNLTPAREEQLSAEVVPKLHGRAACTTRQVLPGDTCEALATKCGITPVQFTTYNPSSTLCSTLQPGGHVCCSAGIMPDFTPKPDADGSCAVYVVQSGDWCSKIAAANSITLEYINVYNRNTWGWAGCEKLIVGLKMCLSSGAAPMPAPVIGAVCGPTKPGTLKPIVGQKLADLSPCPLKACCNIWGQCGTTAEFCTIAISETAAPGANGCVQNCGMDIINNATGPKLFRRVHYFEAWNEERPCLHMHVADVPRGPETVIHYSFAEIDPTTFDVDISKITSQWQDFVSLTGAKRVIAFGGWTFSTNSTTSYIFREAVMPANRDRFATNCANFLKLYDLDGLDFDWEYPGAKDIPGMGIGSDDEGTNYLEFLKLVRAKLPAEKTLSIAAPASFWYLKAFPIDLISDVVDYIVYMTYDLHGQWDYGSQWSSTGCPSGNCLRSHINITETLNALVMITKAGVPTNKILVGTTSYGRSFKMEDANCRGPMCKFIGKESAAAKGRCTDTAGYLANAEIDAIIADAKATGKSIQQWHDTTDSDYLIFGDREWVAYMTDSTKDLRIITYSGMKFGGVSDWAIDLKTFRDGDSLGWPSVTNGQCKGVDCVGNQCVGTACVSLGCDGPGCVGGLCTTANCKSVACMGSDCINGVCSGPACKTRGCSGPNCGAEGECNGAKCVSVGCSGQDCIAETGLCSGIDCAKTACGGSNCQNGVCLEGSSTCEGMDMQPWPTLTTGECKGPDCVGGVCIGVRCASFGCITTNGSCSTGVCRDGSCTITACIGPGCINGLCMEPGCKTTGCVGKDCNRAGDCTGPDCVAIGCVGDDCDAATGLCTGPACTKKTCVGSDCDRGSCEGGSECASFAKCAGSDCGVTSECKGSDCFSCTGDDCDDGACNGDGCWGCRGSDCHDGRCHGDDCYSCRGSDCDRGECVGAQCNSCVGADCSCVAGFCRCLGLQCSMCTGLGCSCFSLFCGCKGPLCNTCFGLNCSCTGGACTCSGGECGLCKGTNCGCQATSGCTGPGAVTNPSQSCSVSTTVTNCKVNCEYTNYYDEWEISTCTTEPCTTVTGCNTAGQTTTSKSTSAVCDGTYWRPGPWTPATLGQPVATLGPDNVWYSSMDSSRTTAMSSSREPAFEPTNPTATFSEPTATRTGCNTGEPIIGLAGCVFASAIISADLITVAEECPSLCEALTDCIAYQVGVDDTGAIAYCATLNVPTAEAFDVAGTEYNAEYCFDFTIFDYACPAIG